MLNWDCSKDEMTLIVQIADKAAKMAKEMSIKYPKQAAITDITACHCNGCPLDLKGLLEADSFDFGHDVFGIRRSLDRQTGKLMDYFDPRYAKS